MAKRTQATPATSEAAPTAPGSAFVRRLASPVFAQPEPTPDPSTFKIKHPSDDDAYKVIDELNAEHKIFPMPFPLLQTQPQASLTILQLHTILEKQCRHFTRWREMW